MGLTEQDTWGSEVLARRQSFLPLRGEVGVIGK